MKQELRDYFQRVHEQSFKSNDGVIVASSLDFNPASGVYLLNRNLGDLYTISAFEFHQALLEEYSVLVDRRQFRSLENYIVRLDSSTPTKASKEGLALPVHIFLPRESLLINNIFFRSGDKISSTWREQPRGDHK